MGSKSNRQSKCCIAPLAALLLFAAVPATLKAQTFTLQNAGFETGSGAPATFANWTAYTTSGTTTPQTDSSGTHGGTNQIKFDTAAAASTGGVYQRFNTGSGQSYAVEVWARTNDAAVVTGQLGVDPAGGTDPAVVSNWQSTTATTYTRIQVNFTATSSIATVYLRVVKTGGACCKSAWFDDAAHVAITAGCAVTTSGTQCNTGSSWGTAPPYTIAISNSDFLKGRTPYATYSGAGGTCTPPCTGGSVASPWNNNTRLTDGDIQDGNGTCNGSLGWLNNDSANATLEFSFPAIGLNGVHMFTTAADERAALGFSVFYNSGTNSTWTQYGCTIANNNASGVTSLGYTAAGTVTATRLRFVFPQRSSGLPYGSWIRELDMLAAHENVGALNNADFSSTSWNQSVAPNAANQNGVPTSPPGWGVIQWPANSTSYLRQGDDCTSGAPANRLKYDNTGTNDNGQNHVVAKEINWGNFTSVTISGAYARNFFGGTGNASVGVAMSGGAKSWSDVTNSASHSAPTSGSCNSANNWQNYSFTVNKTGSPASFTLMLNVAPTSASGFNAQFGPVTVTGSSTCGATVSAISPSNPIYCGTPITLSVTPGGTTTSVQWFTGSCGGTSAGTGNSINVSPTAPTTYYARPTDGSCNGTCVSTTVDPGTFGGDAAAVWLTHIGDRGSSTSWSLNNSTAGQIPSGGAAPVATVSGNNFDGGIYRSLGTLTSGAVLNVNVLSKRNNSGQGMWAEVRIGTTAPSNGTNYSGGTLIKKWDTNACTSGQNSTWDAGTGTGCQTENGIFTVPSNGTYYLYLRSGDFGGSTTVSWDNVTVCPCSSVPTPSAPALANVRARTVEVAINSADSSANYFAIRVNGGGLTNQYIQANGTIGGTAVWQTKAQWNSTNTSRGNAVSPCPPTTAISGTYVRGLPLGANAIGQTFNFDVQASCSSSGTSPSAFGTPTPITTANLFNPVPVASATCINTVNVQNLAGWANCVVRQTDYDIGGLGRVFLAWDTSPTKGSWTGAEQAWAQDMADTAPSFSSTAAYLHLRADANVPGSGTVSQIALADFGPYNFDVTAPTIGAFNLPTCPPPNTSITVTATVGDANCAGVKSAPASDNICLLGANLLTNPSFESPASISGAWTNGGTAMKMNSTFPNTVGSIPVDPVTGANVEGGNHIGIEQDCPGCSGALTGEVRQTVTVTPNTRYFLSVWVSTANSPTVCESYLKYKLGTPPTGNNQGTVLAQIDFNTSQYRQLAGTVLTGASDTQLTIIGRLEVPNAHGGGVMDYFEVRRCTNPTSWGGNNTTATWTAVSPPTSQKLLASATDNLSNTAYLASPIVNVQPVTPSPTATPLTICNGQSSLLSVTVGSGETADWYSGSCGGSVVATGTTSTTVSPSTTTTYHVRARNLTDGSCVSPTCGQVTVTVNGNPTTPTSPTATPATICNGQSSSLSATISGGETIDWYTGSCGGSPIGSGNPLSVSPSSTTTYHGRARNTTSGCISTTCASVTVNVNPLPAVPTGIGASPATICPGASSTISVTNPGAGLTTDWFSGTCGGSVVATATNSVNVTPGSTTTYFARTRNTTTGCVSACVQVTVNVSSVPATPTSVIATPATICAGATSQLSGSVISGETIDWYTGGCGTGGGGTLVGSGTTLNVTPGSTTTYFARARNTTTSCVSTLCAQVTVTVNLLPAIPSNIQASPATICNGASSTISVNNPGAGFTTDWFTVGCGTTPVPGGTGANSVIVTPGSTTTYFARTRNTTTGCVSACVQVLVTVNSLPTTPGSVQASPAAICNGGGSQLTATVGGGETVDWFTGGCGTGGGGTLIGSGSPFSVNPTTTTTYFARSRNTTTNCSSALCAQVTVTVNQLPNTPTSPLATPATICTGSSSTLSATAGGGETVDWYTGSCGGSLIGSGSPSVSPGATTTCFARARNTTSSCVSTACAQVTVTVNTPPSIDPHPQNQSVCSPNSAVFTVGFTNGSPAPSIQWESSPNGAGWTPIGGANTTTLTITSSDATNYVNGRQFHAVLTSGACVVTSNAAILTITVPPNCCTVVGDCDDGNACTTDSCVSGNCSYAPVSGCCNINTDCSDGDVCTSDVCDTNSHTCSNPPVSGCCNVDGDCDDSDACTTDSCDTLNHTCNNAPVGGCCNVDGDCDDSDACTTDSCDTNNHTCDNAPISGCCNVDGDCDDNNVCTTDTCDTNNHTCANAPVAGCCNTDADCSDGDTCTDDVCDTNNNTCSNPAVPDCCNVDGDCDDSDACTTDTCDTNNHTCTNAPVLDCCNVNGDCDDNNVCTTDTCDTNNHTCTNAPVLDCCNIDSDCGDGDVCTDDVCDTNNHTCSNAQISGCCNVNGDCDDSNACTTDVCDTNNHTCSNAPVQDCCNLNGECDDSDACTTDTCDTNSHTCVFTPVQGCGCSAPQASCQPASITLASDGMGGGTVTLMAAQVDGGSAGGNCSITREISRDGLSWFPSLTFTCADLGTRVIAFRVVQSDNQIATCNAEVTTLEAAVPVCGFTCSPPSAICQSVTLSLVGNSVSMSALAMDGGSQPGTGTECGGITKQGRRTGTGADELDDDVIFICADATRSTQAILRVTQGNGLFSECLADIDVNDDTPPVLFCPSDRIVSPDAGTCEATGVNLGLPSSGDNCGVNPLTKDKPDDYVYPGGDTFVTWTATDPSGNTTTCKEKVTVEDTIPPTITCPADLNIQTDGTGNGCFATNPVLGTPTTGDNCGTPGTGNNGPSQYPIGQTQVKWTATDVAGNTATCTQLVNVAENTNNPCLGQCSPPSAACKPAFQRSLAATGPTLITLADIKQSSAPGASGGCSITLEQIEDPNIGWTNQRSFACFQTGQFAVKFRVTQDYTADPGSQIQTAECTTLVTLVDDTAPTLFCPGDRTVSPDPGECYATTAHFSLGNPSASDCNLSTVTKDRADGFHYPAGQMTAVTWTATDSSGNSTTCVEQVTVESCGGGGCNSNAECNDDNVCTDDVCDTNNHTCSNPPISNCCTSAAQCDDSNPNTADTCESNQCVHKPIPHIASAVSRRTHGATPYDVALPLSGETGIEPRNSSLGTPQVVFTFDTAIEAIDGTPDCSEVTIVNGTCTGASISGSTLTVNLTYAKNLCVTVTLSGLRGAGAGPNLAGTASVTLRSHEGNVRPDTPTPLVNLLDMNQIKGQLFLVVTGANFINDIRVDNTINLLDMNLAKGNLFQTQAVCP